MFGLMKSGCSAESEDQLKNRHFQYCGTCKTIGSMYGNKMRLTLNSDVVFLGELLNSIYGNDDVGECPPAYKSRNCFALPNSDEELPLSFQYAATVNMLLTEAKIDDQIHDSVPYIWILLRKYLSRNFRMAIKKLSDWDFPVNEIWRWAAEQRKRENAFVQLSGNKESEPASTLAHLSEPTHKRRRLPFLAGLSLRTKPMLQINYLSWVMNLEH